MIRNSFYGKECIIEGLEDYASPYNQVFFSINSILFDTCH